MTSLEELERLHRRLAHEFNRTARDTWGWCVKGSGFEHLFQKRKGAADIISKTFTPETLFTRSWPDYYLRGNTRFWFIEAKGPAHVSPTFKGRPRVRIEAFQACLLHHIYRLTGMQTLYVFMEIDGSGIVCPVEHLPIEEICETETFRKIWDHDLREKTRKMFHSLYPDLPSAEVSDPEKGSADPFLAFDKTALRRVGKPVNVWFSEQGVQTFSAKERCAWEGTKSQAKWRTYLPHRSGGLLSSRQMSGDQVMKNEG